MEIKMSEKMTYKVLKQEGRAKRAVMETVHGTIQTPVFMNVGTVAAIKGPCVFILQRIFPRTFAPRFL